MLSVLVVVLASLVPLRTFSTVQDPALEEASKDWKEDAKTNEELIQMGVIHLGPAGPHSHPQNSSQATGNQRMNKPTDGRFRHYSTSRKDKLAFTYKKRLGRRPRLCLISSKGTKKLLGRRCGCKSRYRRRCQKCCKLVRNR